MCGLQFNLGLAYLMLLCDHQTKKVASILHQCRLHDTLLLSLPTLSNEKIGSEGTGQYVEAIREFDQAHSLSQ